VPISSLTSEVVFLFTDYLVWFGFVGGRKQKKVWLKACLHGSPRLINAVESKKVNCVNSSFQRK
jgi:hypothetical protein